MSEALLHQAAYNNAVWCDAVCRAHGRPGQWRGQIWINSRPVPRFYPNAVTLEDTATAVQVRQISELMNAGLAGEWGVKDSFCALDLAALGFRVLFDAEWIHRSASSSIDPDGTQRWSRITAAAELAAWEAAWGSVPGDARVFVPPLLDDPDVAVLAARSDNQVVAGIIANRTGDLVGISNYFAADGSTGLRAGALAAVSATFPGLAMVGYENGTDVDEMRQLGFATIGPLRVWVRDRS